MSYTIEALGLGTLIETDDRAKAVAAYDVYRGMSIRGEGRLDGLRVVLMKDGKVERMHNPDQGVEE